MKIKVYRYQYYEYEGNQKEQLELKHEKFIRSSDFAPWINNEKHVMFHAATDSHKFIINW